MGALNTLTAVEAVNQIAAKKITAEAVVRDCLERIRMREIDVMAWQHIDGERAIERARAADAAGNPGLLRGLPVGVKDSIDTMICLRRTDRRSIKITGRPGMRLAWH